MENLYSDLEEGEILDDDSPPSPAPNLNKRKELPRRYDVKDKTPLHRHKRSCRHSVRHHAKKLSKLKKTPPKKKNSPKWYKKSTCTYEEYTVIDSYTCSKSSKHTLPKKACFSETSLISEIKSSHKSVSPPKKLNTDLNRIKHKTSILKQNFKISENDFASSEISSAKVLKNNMDNSMVNSASTNFDYLTEKDDSNQSLLDLSKNSDDAISIIELCSPTKPTPPLIDLSQSPDHTSNTVELNSDNDTKKLDDVVSNSVLVKDEESEDEEELRRIALATCAKRKALCEPVNTVQNADFTTIVPVPDCAYINNVQICHKEKNNSTSDNYEVVDMDVDEDMQGSLEIAQPPLIEQKMQSGENLFVIDTNPSCDFLEKNNSISEKHSRVNVDDDDLEANILRAQLINSMYRKKLFQENTKPKSNIAIHEKQMPVIHQRKPMINYPKPNLLFCHKRLKSAKHFLRKRSVNKLVNNSKKINNNNKAPSLPVQVNKPSERLIITVNGESSDDSDDETNTVPENPVDSIVALISDCRQKSDSIVENKEKENIPKALMCLSKAQQEEYNSLMKILAKKKKLAVADKKVSVKNGSVHSPMDDLKKLDEKLVALQGALKNKKQSMALLAKEVNSKKLHYMKAKLTTQHLKEQLVAAEKVRKAKLLDWSKTCDSLKLMKKSLSDLENKVNEVQNLRSKIGSSLQGQSYKLPQLSSVNKQS